MKDRKTQVKQLLRHCALAICIASLLPTTQMTGMANGRLRQTQSEPEIRLLVSGKPVEREIAGGQSHSSRRCR